MTVYSNPQATLASPSNCDTAHQSLAALIYPRTWLFLPAYFNQAKTDMIPVKFGLLYRLWSADSPLSHTHLWNVANTVMAMVDVPPTQTPRLQHLTETPPNWPTTPQHLETIVTWNVNCTSGIQTIPWRILSIIYSDLSSSDLPLEVFRDSGSSNTTTTPYHQE